MTKRRIDYACRFKDYTAKATVNNLPVSEEQMSALISLIDYVKERTDVSVVVQINDEVYKGDVPQSVLLTKSPYGLYMELTYSMENRDGDHPVLLANDHLTNEEAVSVLVSIFHECTNDIEVIFNYIGEVSSSIYPEKEDSDESEDTEYAEGSGTI